MRILLSPPHTGFEERELLLNAFDSNWIAPLGPHVEGFEREVAAHAGMRAAAACSSGTAALHLALLALGVKEGDRVFVSTLTFAATVNAIRYVGAIPVFIDADPDTWNMDPNLLESAMNQAAQKGNLPSCVVVVDLYGQCADYERIQPVCDRFEVPIVEDAAEALGASYQGKPAGAFGRAGIFSFNGNKIITCGGGGMLVSDDEKMVAKARFLSTQAREPVRHYEHHHVGYNYRLSNLLAAVGRGQLRSLGDKVERRRAHNAAYKAALSSVQGFGFLEEAPSCFSTFWLTTLVIDSTAKCSRDELIDALGQADIEARPVWKPMHMQPIFSEFPTEGGEVAERLFAEGLCLPSGSSLSDADRDRVIEVIRRRCE